MEHQSVLLKETIDMLDVKKDGIYVDCTLGRGGHSEQILKRCPQGFLYCLDCDQEAIDQSTKRLLKVSNNFKCIHTSFENLKEVLAKEGVFGVDGIVMDLGVSSPQFDDPSRGFSYRFDARLDMRMDQSQEMDAWKVINTYDQKDLFRIFRDYGQNPNAYRIASQVVKARQQHPIDTTFQLVDVIKSCLPAKVLSKKGHPAKQIFQAIRIEVNRELLQLEIVLRDAISLLKPGGRLAVITFHSLEDTIVKRMFRDVAVQKKADRRLPQLGIEKLEYELISKKPVTASRQELEENFRSHSAKLRGLKKLGAN